LNPHRQLSVRVESSVMNIGQVPSICWKKKKKMTSSRLLINNATECLLFRDQYV
jgi:hypothetical protein